MAKKIFDISGRKGLAQYPSQSLRNAYAVPDGLILEGIFNPFVRYGYLSPSTGTLTNVTADQTIGSNISCSIYDAINDDFYIGTGSQIFRGDTMSDTSLTRVVQISGMDVKDMEIYQIFGARKLFVMYSDGSNNYDIAISDLAYNSGTDDPTWLSATVTGHFVTAGTGDMFMQVSDNGFAYLFFENQVSKIDGTATGGSNGTISTALAFPAGYRMVDCLDFRGKMMIAIHSYNINTRNNNPGFFPGGRLDVGIYIWDKQQTVSSSSDYIPLTGFNVIHKIFLSPSGEIRVLATDASGYTMLLKYNGATFQTIQRIGFNAHPLYRDSVGNFANMSTWFGRDGNLYMYGSLAPGDTEGLYKIFAVGVSSTSGGVILSASGSTSTSPGIYLFYADSGNTLTSSRLNIFTIISQSGADTTASRTITYPVQILPKLSTVNFLRIFGAPSATTGSTTIATINIYLNQAVTAWASKTITLDQWSRGYIDIPINKPYVNTIQIDVTFANGLTIGTSDFAPAYAELDYTPTETNK